MAQEFDETLRGANLTEAWHRSRVEPDGAEREPPTWSGFWDAITKDYGFTVFEAPEWPKPTKCRRMWGPTNDRYAGLVKNRFSKNNYLSRGLGRIDFPSTLIRSDVTNAAVLGKQEDEERQKSLVCIYQGYKQGMEFLRSAWNECGVTRLPAGNIRMVEVADEEDMHTIGLARDPMAKLVSAFKEILIRLPMRLKWKHMVDSEETDFYRRTEKFLGLEQTYSCLDWIFIGHFGKSKGNIQYKKGKWSEAEAERFLAFVDAINCGCRFLDWQHAASSTWWMSLRRTVTGTDWEASRFESRYKTFRNPIVGSLPIAMANISSHEDIKRTGYATPRIDEIWNTVDLSAEVPRLISRFDIPQSTNTIGKTYGSCENQSARTYLGTSKEKDNGESRAPSPPTATLHELAAEVSVAESVCDSFAQDYICYGLQPPRACADLRATMEKYNLVVYNDEEYSHHAESI